MGADPPEDVVDAVPGQQGHKHVLQRQKHGLVLLVLISGGVLVSELYLLSCIHGDGQAVWHQAGCPVLLHQPH